MTDMTSQTELEGQIEKVTYSNEETGYTVATISARGYLEPVIIVGKIIAPNPGEIILVKGVWVNHPRFGRQFKVEEHAKKVPATVVGIKKYLSSGLVKGIGPVMASRIVRKFGEKTLDIIEHKPHKLIQVEGVGPKRVEMIKRAWRDQKEIRDVMIFLQSHDVGTGYAAKIFRQYGKSSISVVTGNPYRLATDIFGIGFNTADKIAEKLGFENTAPVRVEAGILYVMNQLAEEGHVYYPYNLLVERCRDVLRVDTDAVIGAFASVADSKMIVVEDLNGDTGRLATDKKAVYLTRFYVSET